MISEVEIASEEEKRWLELSGGDKGNFSFIWNILFPLLNLKTEAKMFNSTC